MDILNNWKDNFLKYVFTFSLKQGKIFYVTPSVIPSPSAIAEIIESAGGIMEKTRRPIVQIQEMNAGKLNYIIVTHDNDLHLLSDVLRANIGK